MMSPFGHKRRRSGGLTKPSNKPKRKLQQALRPPIVRDELRQNNARQTFIGSQRRGWVSCGGECWHDVSATAPSVHNAFLRLPAPNIARLSLPKPEPYKIAVNKASVFRDTSEPTNTDQIDKSDSFGKLQRLPDTIHCAFVSLKVATNRYYQPRGSTVFDRVTQFKRRGSSTAFQQSLELVNRLSPDLWSSFSHPIGASSPRIPQSTARSEAFSLLRTPVTPAYSLITPTAVPDLAEAMAPVRDPESVQSSMKDVIQTLYDIQSQVHGFVPETQSLLIDKVSELATSLSHLQSLTSKEQSPNNPIHDIRIAPEFIDYVDDGRNPDIYARDFVELVQRGNSVVNGKQKAFRDFSEIYAKALKDGFGGIGKEVDQVMENAGLDEQSRSSQGQNGNKAS